MPKQYLPTTATNSHPTTTFQKHRTHNKQLYNQYYNNFGRQNMDIFNKMNSQQFQLQQQQQALHMVFPSPLALQLNKPTMVYTNVRSHNTKNNNIELEGTEINIPISHCGRKTRDDTNTSSSDVLYYYCNNRITNYKNPTQQQLVSIQPTTSSTSTTTSASTTTTTTSTTETPSNITTRYQSKFLNIFTTEKPIFLPTPNNLIENSFVPITSAAISKNSIIGEGNDDNFKLQRQKYRQKKYEHQLQPVSRHEDIKRQQQYTTAAAAYDNMKLHSFFTIEDAVTRAPDMQVFNDPYQAYRHARRQQINQQRPISAMTKLPDTTTTTTKPNFKSFFDDIDDEDYPDLYRHVKRNKINNHRQTSKITTKIPDVTTTTTKPKFKSFFDDLSDDDDYINREAHQYDYSLFNSPQKSVYYKTELKDENQVLKPNHIIDHTHKTTEANEVPAVDETFVSKPKIKQHNFGLFQSVFPTAYTLPAVTTYKPNGKFKELFLTTHKIPVLTAYNSKPITYTTTLEAILGNPEAIIEKENSIDIFLNEVPTTTVIPITTTTEKTSIKTAFRPSLKLRSSPTFKYPKQLRINKSYKNLTAITTNATITLKKTPKYHRQYKTKKLKQFNHLYTTSTTSTTTIPTTSESYTKKFTTSTTEEPTTKKAIFTRTFSTTDLPKQNNIRQRASLPTEATKRKKIKSRTSTSSTIAANESPVRLQPTRRGSKRSNTFIKEKDVPPLTTPKANNKNRRRLASSSTTAKPLNTKTIVGSPSTSTPSSTATPVLLRTYSTMTTLKSVMRVTNTKSRTKLRKSVKTSIKAPNEMSDERQAFDRKTSLKTIASTMASIPPLPIEIYFKKSQISKI